MSRKFIAIITSAALTITAFGASTRPAAAADDDTARAIVTILGIALVGAAIANKRRDDRASRSTIQPIHPRPLPDRVRYGKLLPQNCLRTFDTRHGPMRGFGARCLDRHYGRTASLPNTCAVRVFTRNGRGTGYEARCLRRHGYRLARG